MTTRSYALPGLVLRPGKAFLQPVKDFQRDLRALGYFAGPIDGVFGRATAVAVAALVYDLTNNSGHSTATDGDAPLAVSSYRRGNETETADQALVASMAAMLDDPNFPKLPSSADPAGDNRKALNAIRSMRPCPVPIPFLLAILDQESGLRHYQVPAGNDADNFIRVGLDRNDPANPSRITSRGYGVGQFTLFHHPPTQEEVDSTLLDPVKGLKKTIEELVSKFNTSVMGAPNGAEDRAAEFGPSPLRKCKYDPTDSRYLRDCVHCVKTAGLVQIEAGVTPLYAGASQVYAKSKYHPGSYSNVPRRDKVGCDWPYAMRRFNGAGANSYAYQAEVLLKVAAQG